MTTTPRGAAPAPQMAHQQLRDETPTTPGAPPRVMRSSPLRMWALFASGMAAVAAVMLAAAPAAAPAPAPADPPPCVLDYLNYCPPTPDPHPSAARQLPPPATVAPLPPDNLNVPPSGTARDNPSFTPASPRPHPSFPAPGDPGGPPPLCQYSQSGSQYYLDQPQPCTPVTFPLDPVDP